MRVGNLYLNRPITGALVQRHLRRLSDVRHRQQSGRYDYLLQFLIPIAVSENTMRRGFAPASDEESM
ncbi:MAG: hypothetical protein R3B91_13720 [Planctomycetaceae bacterium]